MGEYLARCAAEARHSATNQLAEIAPRYDVCETKEKVHSKAAEVMMTTISDYVLNPNYLAVPDRRRPPQQKRQGSQ